MVSLGRRRRATFEALLPLTLGLDPADGPRVKIAAGRLHDFVRCIPDEAAARDALVVLDGIAALSFVQYARLPACPRPSSPPSSPSSTSGS